MDSLTLASPAKVNLYLKILGKRADGFRELETVMAALSLADQMRFDVKPKELTLECDAKEVPVDDTNLARRAAKLLREKFNVRQGAHITIRKQTPIGGGMGGGSSNAATTLRALNDLWNLKASASELQSIAALLGSDVPFFLQPGVALCRGRGEIIAPLAKDQCGGLEGLSVVLVNPGFGVSTSWAYKAYAARGGADAEGKRQAVRLLEALNVGTVDAIAAELFNSLEAPVFHKYPILNMLKRALLQAGAAGALMSGSGATVFGLCESEKNAQAVRDKVVAAFGPSLWTRVSSFAISLQVA